MEDAPDGTEREDSANWRLPKWQPAADIVALCPR
jgi:hypothetical protein